MISEEVVFVLVDFPSLSTQVSQYRGRLHISSHCSYLQRYKANETISLPCIMHPACLQSGLIFVYFLSFSSSIAVRSNALLLSDSPSYPGVWLCLFPLVHYWSMTDEGTSF